MKEYMKDSNWIWNPCWGAQDKDAPRIVLFRKRIELEAEPFAGRIRISADTRYKLYINEKLVEAGPSRGDRQVWFYDTIDILPYLERGVNIIGVSVLRYPEDPAAGNHGMFRTSLPGLYVVGEVEDVNGKIYGVSADSTWKCLTDKSVAFYREEERFAPLVVHERSAGNPEVFGWKGKAYDDGRWHEAKAYIKKLVPEAVSPGNLKPRNIPYMYRKKRRFQGVMDLKRSDHTKEEWEKFLKGEQTLVIPANTETIVELNAGEEMTGYVRAAFSGGKDTEVSLLYAEAYVQEGFVGPEHIPVKADRTDMSVDICRVMRIYILWQASAGRRSRKSMSRIGFGRSVSSVCISERIEKH